MKHFTSLRSLWMGVLLLLLFSCREQGELNPSPATVISVTDARQWFDQESNAAAGRTTKKLPKRTPQWSRAKTITLTDGTPAVAIPLQYDERGVGTGSLVNLVVFRKHGQVKVQVMKMVSDPVYFFKNKEKIDLHNFTGLLTMHDWQEGFLYGASYKNGKAVGRVSLPGASGRIGPTCSLVTITHYVRVCVGADCETSIDYVEQYMDCSGGGGGGGEDPLPTGPIGGGGGGGTPPSPGQPLPFTFLKPRAISMPGQEGAPIDLKRYLDCFGAITDNATYEITVYVDEPYSGSGFGKLFVDVGHAFVGFKKQYPGTDSYVQQVFGFYPNEPGPEVLAGPVPSKVSSNGSAPYTVSMTYTVTAGQFQRAMDAAQGATGQNYNLVGNNCVNFVFGITNAAGLPVPQNGTMLPWGGGYGYTPGQLGNDLRNNSQNQANTNAGNAPMSLGPC